MSGDFAGWAACVAPSRAFVKPTPEFVPTKYEQVVINSRFAEKMERGEVLPPIPIDPKISIVDGGRIAREAGRRNLISADITRAVGDHTLAVIRIGPQRV